MTARGVNGAGMGCGTMRAGCHRIITLLLLMLPIAINVQAAKDPRADVDRIVAQWTDANSPGVAIAATKDGQIVFSRGYGLADVEHHVPVTPGTPFDIGSITKQFTAFAVAMLVEKGTLSLDDDVRKFIPEMRVRGGPITIEHLLNHTSGLRDEFNLLTMEGYGVDDAVTFEHSLRVITSQEDLLFEPGQQWAYCNSGYTLLAEIIKRVTGREYAEWMKENVCDPLGMTRTRFPGDAGAIVPDRAYSYTEGAGGLRKAVVSKASLGCSNLYSTVEDLARWAINLTDGRTVGGAVVDRMGEGGVLNDGSPTGYAWGQFTGEYRGLRTFSHDGGIGGFRSALIRFPDRAVTVVVLANADYFRAMTLAKEVAGVLIDDLAQGGSPSAASAQQGETSDGNQIALEDCVGSYRLESTGKVLEVVLQDSLLLVKNLAKSSELLALSPGPGSQFTVKGVGLKLSFDRGSEGVAERLTLHVGDPPQIATRVSLIQLRPEQLARFAGLYVSTQLLTTYALAVEGGVLKARHARWPTSDLTPVGETDFTGAKPWLRSVRFDVGEAGSIEGFWADAANAKRVYFRKLM